MTYRKPRVEEGQCPECLAWSLVAWDGTLPPGGFWWADAQKGGGVGCPKCGAVVLVESECEFRPATLHGHVQALGLRLVELRRQVRKGVLDDVARVWRWVVGP